MPSQLNMLCQIPRLYLAWGTVKAKGSAGGIDGMTIIEFEHNKRKEISQLAEELKAGTWKPQPYMEIEVAKTKNPDEIRKLGMTVFATKLCSMEKIIVKREDWVNIYPLCTECYAHITYIPDIKKKEPVKIVVI